ncbi:MAG: UDP-N-acetylmuramate--L-alanine ligase [Actinobacteria bacterium]|nr:UDP-N-acetylmuramate--L-alanine ligase [Actinomycetota bacterium]NCV42352.1 UDP-N-acetylmuramate--L-alanine ligase [Actinomycetota bacterium]NCW43674.1 UDP-N-acetylmuramate--L-alanine ligase [Actinomycetota bacterium]NCW92276.1 UDP-N-acetylmuramate--L-alanine ligase [Actinomycetota bacterium]NCX15714.1 UDP-N-acetylmuramate--L-alanine ligase [Actinomycetota bacterium]
MQSLIGKRVHFIGIGGAGMSGLARISLSHAITVSGSDAKDSSVVKALQALGATISTTHAAANVDGADLVVYSNAISPSNAELMRAQELKLTTLTRAAALSILMSESKSIAVAGTHGKTTTSSMMAVALQACGADPSFAIGGTITASGSNAHRGTGEIFVAEADESDGSFIEYHPYAAIVTNVEHDHVDFFATPADVAQAFKDFAATIKPEGFLTYCADDEGAQALASSVTTCSLISYGTGEECDLRLDSIELEAMGSRARAIWRGKVVGFIELQVPGHHNLLNAAAVLTTGLNLGFAAPELLTGLAVFRGTGRRFELKGTVHGIRVIDDYGHHPTEIDVTLKAARRYAGDGRLIVIFQPHRYSRTKAFSSQFAKVLDMADRAIVLEVYAASEKPIAGVTSRLITDAMSHGEYIPNFIEVTDSVVDSAEPQDVIITLGAGDVSSLAPIIVDGLSRRFG